jgi:hypothetical protein
MTRQERQDVLQALEALLPKGEHIYSVPVVHEGLPDLPNNGNHPRLCWSRPKSQRSD